MFLNCHMCQFTVAEYLSLTKTLFREKGACKDYKFASSIGDEEGVECLKSKNGKWCGKIEFKN